MGHFDCLRGNTQLRGPCPLHGPAREASRSFSVNLRKNVFRCLNPECAAKGNVLDLWAAYRNLPIYEAAIDLVDTFQLDTKPNRGEATRNSEPPQRVPDALTKHVKNLASSRPTPLD